MVTHISHKAEDTERLGESWGRMAVSGWLIGLMGELGTGKTQLVKGLARGLEITDRVHSPTFALVNEYSGGRIPLRHLDLYRLETPKAILTAGLEEYLSKPLGVTVVEWIEHWLAWQAEAMALVAKLKAATVSTQSESCHSLPSTPTAHSPTIGDSVYCRLVYLETLSENQRRVSYEDIGS